MESSWGSPSILLPPATLVSRRSMPAHDTTSRSCFKAESANSGEPTQMGRREPPSWLSYWAWRSKGPVVSTVNLQSGRETAAREARERNKGTGARRAGPIKLRRLTSSSTSCCVQVMISPWCTVQIELWRPWCSPTSCMRTEDLTACLGLASRNAHSPRKTGMIIPHHASKAGA